MAEGGRGREGEGGGGRGRGREVENSIGEVFPLSSSQQCFSQEINRRTNTRSKRLTQNTCRSIQVKNKGLQLMCETCKRLLPRNAKDYFLCMDYEEGCQVRKLEDDYRMHSKHITNMTSA